MSFMKAICFVHYHIPTPIVVIRHLLTAWIGELLIPKVTFISGIL